MVFPLLKKRYGVDSLASCAAGASEVRKLVCDVSPVVWKEFIIIAGCVCEADKLFSTI